MKSSCPVYVHCLALALLAQPLAHAVANKSDPGLSHHDHGKASAKTGDGLVAPSTELTLQLKHEGKQTIIPICTSFPLRGDSNIIGRQMLAGVENYLRGFKHFAADQATTERPFILEYANNNDLIGPAAIAKVQRLIKINPILLGLVGMDTMLSLQPLLKQDKLLLLFPIEGDPALRSASLKNVIYFRPTYTKELRALADYAIKTFHRNHVAIFYEASTWGQHAYDTLRTILKQYEIASLVSASYPQGTVDIENALNIISNRTLDGANIANSTSPNVVFCLAQPRPAMSFISNAINAGLHECKFVGLSNLVVIQKLLKTTKGLDLAVTAVVPNPHQTAIPIATEYLGVMKQFLSFHDDSPFYFEAFINCSIFEYCLKQHQQPTTIAQLISTLESLDINFKGLRLKFDPTDRSLSSAIWINPGMNKPWFLVTGK